MNLFALIGPLGWSELLIIFFIILIIFGPRKLPEVAEALGKSIQKFKRPYQRKLIHVTTSLILPIPSQQNRNDEYADRTHQVNAKRKAEGKAEHHQVDVNGADVKIGGADKHIPDDLTLRQDDPNDFTRDRTHDDPEKQNERDNT